MKITSSKTQSTILLPGNNSGNKSHHSKNKDRILFGSLTRTSNLMQQPFEIQPLPLKEWDTGDYVVGRYLGRVENDNNPEQKLTDVETTTGHQVELMQGDLLVGSLGRRQATQEICGDWKLVRPNHKDGSITLQDVCGSGLFGREISHSPYYPGPASFQYQGHVVRQGHKVCMQDFVDHTIKASGPPSCSTVLIMGTSMSSGKTETGRVVTKLLKEKGFQQLVYTKLTGAGYYHDILSMAKQVDGILDFVDAGLPSTVMDPQAYRQALRHLLGRIVTCYQPDCLVVELGASPCEPYNGWVALQEFRQPDLIIMCATDPYSVVGMQHILRTCRCHWKAPMIVCGQVANTTAGRDLVQRLTGLEALCLAKTSSTVPMGAQTNDSSSSSAESGIQKLEHVLDKCCGNGINTSTAAFGRDTYEMELPYKKPKQELRQEDDEMVVTMDSR